MTKYITAFFLLLILWGCQSKENVKLDIVAKPSVQISSDAPLHSKGSQKTTPILLPDNSKIAPNTPAPSSNPKSKTVVPILEKATELLVTPKRFIFNGAGESLKPNAFVKFNTQKIIPLALDKITWEIQDPKLFRMTQPGIFQAEKNYGFTVIVATEKETGLKTKIELLVQRSSGGSSGSGGGSVAQPPSSSQSPSFGCINPNQCSLTIYAGTGVPGQSLPPVLALQAKLNTPTFLLLDGKNNLLFTDSLNHQVKQINPNGQLEVLIGLGLSGFFGDNGPPIFAGLNFPHAIALNGDQIFIADRLNNRIRKVSNNLLITIGGNGTFGQLGDGNPAINSELKFPTDVTVDNSGNIYISDSLNHRVRKIDVNTKLISTVLGTGAAGDNGDSGGANLIQLHSPKGLYLDTGQNHLYIADTQNHKIRKLDLNNNQVSTVAGNGEQGYSGDNGVATQAKIDEPQDIVLDKNNNLYITEANRIRLVSQSKISTLLSGSPILGPKGIAVSNLGDIYFSDSLANIIWKFSVNQ